MDKWLKRSKDNADAENVKGKEEPELMPSSSSTKNSSGKSSSQLSKKRKYNQSFIQYGFTLISKNEEQRPVCFLCNQTLANECLKPWKLKRHLHTKHESYSNKDVEFFKRILRTSESQRKSYESEFRI